MSRNKQNLFLRFCQTIVSNEWLLLILLLPLALFPTPKRFVFFLLIPLLWGLRKVTTGHFVVTTPLDWSLFGLLFMVLISLYATFEVAFSLPKVAGLLYGVAVFYAVVAFTGKADRFLYWGIGVLFACGSIVAALALLGTEWIPKLPLLATITTALPQIVLFTAAPEGFQPNQIAGALLWVAPISLTIAIAAFFNLDQLKKRLSTWHWLFLLSFICCSTLFINGVLLLTQSRGGLIGWSVALAYMFLITRNYSRRFTFIALLLLCIALIFGLWLIVQSDTQLIDTQFLGAGVEIPDKALSTNNLKGRVEIWSRALYGIQDFPFTGMGMGTFRRIAPVFYPFFLHGPDVDIAHAHNHMLQVALDLGLPGLIAYLAIWLGAAAMLWQVWQTSTTPWARTLTLGFSGSLLAYFIYGLTDTVALGAKPGFIFWLLLGLVAGLHRLNNSKI